jgi:hypothetical protein
MIWTDGYTFTPAGQMIGIAIVDGIQFEVWYARDWGDVSGANSNHWDYVAYRATSPRLSVSLDIKKILEDAVARGVINPTHYVSNIEVGNEILSGAGETWITALSLDVQ